MWRYGYTNPVNYNDNELYCGGFSVQWAENGGRCGVCGDNWADPAPRLHEAGGKFGQGIIGRRYTMGQVMWGSGLWEMYCTLCRLWILRSTYPPTTGVTSS